MRWVALISFSVALLGMADEASAGFLDGNALYRYCTATDAFSQGACIGYVDGVADLMGFSDDVAKRPQCIPVSVQAQQVVDVVVKFLRDNPADRNYNADSLVFAAIHQAWNCK